MKKCVIVLFVISFIFNVLLLCYVGFEYYKSRLDKDIFRLNKYAYENSKYSLPEAGENRVVFIGNSITEDWIELRYDYFKKNNFVNRGIGGQTSPLILLRFQSDVVELKPKMVVINAGVNDIGEKTGVYDVDFTMRNIKSMAQLGRANGIEVILTSVLPLSVTETDGYIKNIPEKVIDLNTRIESFAKENDFIYVDYYSEMVDENRGLKLEYSFDGLHPNVEGYMIMEKVLEEHIIYK